MSNEENRTAGAGAPGQARRIVPRFREVPADGSDQPAYDEGPVSDEGQSAAPELPADAALSEASTSDLIDQAIDVPEGDAEGRRR